MTESSEESCGSVTDVAPLPRLPLAASLDANLSYVDLFEAYASEKNMKVADEDTFAPPHDYPAVVQSMLGRLEMFGRLANLRDFTQHSKGSRLKKTKVEGEEDSSETDDKYYDLDDGFIDAENDESDKENLEDFEEAIREGHYTLKADQYLPFDSRQASLLTKHSRHSAPNKRKAKDILSYPCEIQRTLLALRDLYSAHSSEALAVAYPKGAVKLINDTLCLMLCDPTLDRTEVCLTLSEVCGKSLESIEKLAEKQLASNERLKLGAVHSTNLKKLRSMVVCECKGGAPTWTNELQEVYTTCVSSLRASTGSANKYNARYCKKKLQVDLEGEEKKLEADVADWSGGRFLIEDSEVQVAVVGRYTATPTGLQAFLRRPMTSPLLVNLELPSLPKKGSLFDAMPPYECLHFQASSSVIDLQ